MNEGPDHVALNKFLRTSIWSGATSSSLTLATRLCVATGYLSILIETDLCAWQVMNEGPRHVPLNKIVDNMQKHLEWCNKLLSQSNL